MIFDPGGDHSMETQGPKFEEIERNAIDAKKHRVLFLDTAFPIELPIWATPRHHPAQRNPSIRCNWNCGRGVRRDMIVFNGRGCWQMQE
jgi:hypothetical protein